MLIFSKDEILDFAINNKIKWREDKSNSENKYLRNKIRNILIPKIKLTDPLYRENFKDLIEESKRVKKKRDSYLKKFEERYFKTTKNGVIESKKIKWKNLNSKSIEFILFRKYGFFKNNEIVKIINAPTGKIITSKTHELASNRDSLLIKKKSNERTDNFNLKIGFNEKPFNILVEESKESSKPTKQIIFLNKNIKKPLKIRKLEQGDYFYPYGMKGKKKVSKFFKDEKLSIFEKRSKWILTDANNQILWIVGMRVDRRLVKSTGSCLKISI
jgi:tRNA(Ile)-lysidine synthase